jgi:hypothetical protein
VFTRIKQSRDSEYLQVVEAYRDGGKPRQRMVLYVGHYESLDQAMDRMRHELTQLRRRATMAERRHQEQVEFYASYGEGARKDKIVQERLAQLKEEAEQARRAVEWLERKLEEIRNLVAHNPKLLEQDRERVKRLERQEIEAIAAARIARGETSTRSDQPTPPPEDDDSIGAMYARAPTRDPFLARWEQENRRREAEIQAAMARLEAEGVRS